jgi:hypothetical protein
MARSAGQDVGMLADALTPCRLEPEARQARQARRAIGHQRAGNFFSRTMRLPSEPT